jgi:acetyl-CoA carboxylase carboxyl transferase subunit beta
MQEGLFSLMQMAKTSAACERLARAGTPFICVFTDPTMAGVLASYASLADVIIAEPAALVGFAGARVAAQAAQGGKLPDDFQTSEFNWRVGMVDKIVERRDMRNTLARLVRHLGGTRG